MIVALMIGELHWMPRLNHISSEIVRKSVDIWRQCPGALLVCESEPMRKLAEELGVPAASLWTALPQPSGHKTRLLALALLPQRDRFPAGEWMIVTHELHEARAKRIFERCGLQVSSTGLAVPFARDDHDWKLRSAGIFRVYNTIAWVYCGMRGWV